MLEVVHAGVMLEVSEHRLKDRNVSSMKTPSLAKIRTPGAASVQKHSDLGILLKSNKHAIQSRILNRDAPHLW